MTEIRKSDAQLDAEAAAPVDYSRLFERISDHRRNYRDELPLRLTSSSVPEDVEPIAVHAKVGDEWRPTGAHLDVQDAGELGGPALSPALVAYVTEPPRGYLWAGALFALRRNCRRLHPEHAEAQWRGALCHRLVYQVIVAERPYEAACYELGLYPSRSVRVLDRALAWMEEHIGTRQKREADRANAEAGYGTGWEKAHEHRALPGMHMEDCAQCRRNAA